MVMSALRCVTASWWMLGYGGSSDMSIGYAYGRIEPECWRGPVAMW